NQRRQGEDDRRRDRRPVPRQEVSPASAHMTDPGSVASPRAETPCRRGGFCFLGFFRIRRAGGRASGRDGLPAGGLVLQVCLIEWQKRYLGKRLSFWRAENDAGLFKPPSGRQ